MPSSKLPLTLIVAATQSNGIGLNGGLPWRLPQEMKYFAKVTTEGCGAMAERPNAVVMGRKTWDGIPGKFRPLKGRTNVVVSRSSEVDLSDAPCTTLHSSLESALSSPPVLSSTQTFLIGGSQIYRLALQSNLVDRILLTRILDPEFGECDAFLEEFRDGGRWRKCERGELSAWCGFDVEEGEREEKGVRYAFEMWVLND